MGEEDSGAAGLRAATVQPGGLVLGQTPRPQHCQWYDLQRFKTHLEHFRTNLTLTAGQIIYTCVFSFVSVENLFKKIK